MKLKIPNLFFLIIVLIVGPSLYQQYDSKTGSFINPYLAGIYALAFIPCFILLIRSMIRK